MDADDRQLLRRTHAGHEASARELWKRHAGWMLAYGRTVLGRHGQSADDVVQTVFCRLLQLDRRSVREVREVRPWLARLVRHAALNHVRQSRRATERDRRVPAPAETRTAARPLEHRPDPGLALDALPRRLREVVHLRHVAGLSTEQTALALGLPKGTVASRHHAAIARMRCTMEGAGRAAPPRGVQHVAPL